MKFGPQDFSLVGAQGVALTVYVLRRLGHPAIEMGEGLPFDVLLPINGGLVKVQVKTTQTCDDKGRHTFIAGRGRYASKTLHASPLTKYVEGEIDLMAFASVTLDKVVFLSPDTISTTKVTLHRDEFLAENAAKDSLLKAVGSMTKP